MSNLADTARTAGVDIRAKSSRSSKDTRKRNTHALFNDAPNVTSDNTTIGAGVLFGDLAAVDQILHAPEITSGNNNTGTGSLFGEVASVDQLLRPPIVTTDNDTISTESLQVDLSTVVSILDGIACTTPTRPTRPQSIDEPNTKTNRISAQLVSLVSNPPPSTCPSHSIDVPGSTPMTPSKDAAPWTKHKRRRFVELEFAGCDVIRKL